MPRDYQHGYRAGQKAKFCLCITPAEDCTECGKFFKRDNDAVIAARNADRAVAGDYADEGDSAQSCGRVKLATARGAGHSPWRGAIHDSLRFRRCIYGIPAVVMVMVELLAL